MLVPWARNWIFFFIIAGKIKKFGVDHWVGHRVGHTVGHGRGHGLAQVLYTPIAVFLFNIWLIL